MASTAVVTGTFQAEWDLDDYRTMWMGADGLTDEEILAECLDEVRQNPRDYVDAIVHIEGSLA